MENDSSVPAAPIWSYSHAFRLYSLLVLFQLLLTFDPVLVEKVALLLYHMMQDNPTLSRLYLTGVFFFILMYTGSNVLPVARFLKYCHLKQAFRSEEVGAGWPLQAGQLHRRCFQCQSGIPNRNSFPQSTTRRRI